jgi:hypothetical protein
LIEERQDVVGKYIERVLELGFRFIRHALRRVNRTQIRIIHCERPIHLCTEPLRHLNRLLDFNERVIHPAFAEIQLAQSAPGLEIVWLDRQELFNFGDFFIGVQGLIAGIDDGPALFLSRSGWFVHTIPYRTTIC